MRVLWTSYAQLENAGDAVPVIQLQKHQACRTRTSGSLAKEMKPPRIERMVVHIPSGCVAKINIPWPWPWPWPWRIERSKLCRQPWVVGTLRTQWLLGLWLFNDWVSPYAFYAFYSAPESLGFIFRDRGPLLKVIGCLVARTRMLIHRSDCLPRPHSREALRQPWLQTAGPGCSEKFPCAPTTFNYSVTQWLLCSMRSMRFLRCGIICTRRHCFAKATCGQRFTSLPHWVKRNHTCTAAGKIRHTQVPEWLSRACTGISGWKRGWDWLFIFL